MWVVLAGHLVWSPVGGEGRRWGVGYGWICRTRRWHGYTSCSCLREAKLRGRKSGSVTENPALYIALVPCCESVTPPFSSKDKWNNSASALHGEQQQWPSGLPLKAGVGSSQGNFTTTISFPFPAAPPPHSSASPLQPLSTQSWAVGAQEFPLLSASPSTFHKADRGIFHLLTFLFSSLINFGPDGQSPISQHAFDWQEPLINLIRMKSSSGHLLCLAFSIPHIPPLSAE